MKTSSLRDVKKSFWLKILQALVAVFTT
jgi:hypothetical protein